MVNCKAVKEIKLLKIGSSEVLQILYTEKNKKERKYWQKPNYSLNAL